MPALMPRNPHRNAPEYADRVNLIKKIKIGKEWRFAPVVPEANGRLKDKVRVNGQVEVHIEGSYFIEWWVSGRRFREATTREDAIECARHKTVELRAIRAGLIASPEPATTRGRSEDAYRRRHRRLSEVRQDAAEESDLPYLSLHPRRSPAGFLQEKVRGGCHAARCYRLYDVLLRARIGSAYRLRQGRDGAPALQASWTREAAGKGRLAQLRRYHPPHLRAGGADGDVQGCDRR